MTKANSAAKTSTGKRPVLVAVATPAKTGLATAAKAKARPKAATKAAPKAAPKPAKPRAKRPAVIPAEQRRNYIEVAAYHIAERRGFAPGDPLADWTQAEAEIDRLVAEGHLGA